VQTVAEARASGSSQVIIDAPVPRLLASGAISPNYSRIAVLVTPWPKQRGRQKLDKAQRVEIARVGAMVAPDLLILRGAAWIDPERAAYSNFRGCAFHGWTDCKPSA